jgi:hypothetical protein
MKIAGLVSVGVGALAIGLGVKFGLDARSAADDISNFQGGSWTDEQLQREDDGKSAEKKMIIFTGVGAAAVIGGGVLYLLGSKKKAGRGDASALAPLLSPDRVGFAYTGSF